MAEKAPDFRIDPAAYHIWERLGLMDIELSTLIDRLVALDVSRVHVSRVVPYRDLRLVIAVLEGRLVRVHVEVDPRGRWRIVREVLARQSEVS